MDKEKKNTTPKPQKRAPAPTSGRAAQVFAIILAVGTLAVLLLANFSKNGCEQQGTAPEDEPYTAWTVEIPSEEDIIEARPQTSGEWEYTISETGDVTITAYTGKAVLVEVPELLNGFFVTAIGENAFAGLPVRSVRLPGGVKTIGANCFKDCKQLVSVDLGRGVQRVGDSAFEGCSVLFTLTTGASLTTIGDRAFAETPALKEIELHSLVKTLGNSAFENSGLTEISLNRVEKVGERCFYGCPLTEVVIFASTRAIASDAFGDAANAVFLVQPGSYAEKYGKEQGLTCIAG